MKKLAILILGVYSSFSVLAQEEYVFDTLDINDVIAPVYAGGPYFMNPVEGSPDYAVNSDIKVIYACSPWIVGLDELDSLHVSAETFKDPFSPYLDTCIAPNGDTLSSIDFWTGPQAHDYNENYDSRYYNIWKVDQSEIDYHLNNYNSAGYVIPEDFLTWPGNGDANNGEPEQLAPYYDMNNNGVYEPELGDAPMIKGDQAIYMILTDAREVNTFSDGERVGVDLHFTFYTIACPAYEIPQVNETTFINMRVVNRSAHNYHDLYVANWTDFDIGGSSDDHIGTSIENNLIYAYNSAPIDYPGTSSLGFGINPPACGLMYLNHELSHTMKQYLGFHPNLGDPQVPSDYHNYIRSRYRDGSPFYDNEGFEVSHIYTDSPTDENGWSEHTANIPPADKRGIASIGPFDLGVGEEIDVDFAIVYARGEWENDSLGYIQNVDLLIENAEQIQMYYDGQTTCSTIGTEEVSEGELSVYPNPSIGVINVSSEISGQLDIYNLSGQIVYSETMISDRLAIDVSEFASGLYFIRQGGETIQFVKE